MDERKCLIFKIKFYERRPVIDTNSDDCEKWGKDHELEILSQKSNIPT